MGKLLSDNHQNVIWYFILLVVPDAKGMKFLAHFVDGGKYNNSSGQNCTLSMDVEFDCNQNEVWTTSKEKKATISPTALTKIDYDSGACKVCEMW